jgi:hypothetical protein
LVHMVLSNLKVTGCGKIPGEKVLSNSPRLVVVRYQDGC